MFTLPVQLVKKDAVSGVLHSDKKKKEKHTISLELCKPFVVMRYKADQMWRDGHSLKSNTVKCYR